MHASCKRPITIKGYVWLMRACLSLFSPHWKEDSLKMPQTRRNRQQMDYSDEKGPKITKVCYTIAGI